MGRTHLVSGVTSGIGQAVYERLKSSGDTVIPVVRSSETAEKLSIPEYMVADFSDLSAVRVAFQSFDRPIDSFINCAGVAIGKPVWETPEQEVIDLMNINLLSPMLACGELRKNIKPGGAIILFSSQSAFRGGWDDSYIASKGGINSIVKSLAQKFAPAVRVIGVAPGVTANTRMTSERKQDDLGAIAAQIPLKRLGLVSEIAEMVHVLIGPAGSHMTGAMVDMNGGAYLR